MELMNKDFPILTKIVALVLIINIAYVAYQLTFSKKEAIASDSSGAKIFKANCAGCHKGGQNLIKSKKPIIGSAVINSKESLKAYLSEPHPPMPKFSKIAKDDEMLGALQKHLKTLK